MIGSLFNRKREIPDRVKPTPIQRIDWNKGGVVKSTSDKRVGENGPETIMPRYNGKPVNDPNEVSRLIRENGLPPSYPNHMVRKEMINPNDILNDFMKRQREELNHHATQIAHYAKIIDDAQKRMNNHIIARDALQATLEPIETVNKVDISNEDISDKKAVIATGSRTGKTT